MEILIRSLIEDIDNYRSDSIATQIIIEPLTSLELSKFQEDRFIRYNKATLIKFLKSEDVTIRNTTIHSMLTRGISNTKKYINTTLFWHLLIWSPKHFRWSLLVHISSIC
jgi:hypothetical protein